MADKRAINRICRINDTDTEMVEQFRKANEQSWRILRENPQPDTFLGRKTQEPFPPERES